MNRNMIALTLSLLVSPALAPTAMAQSAPQRAFTADSLEV
jgi:hypothetical protein